MKVIEIEQGGEDWKQYREGKLTGTKIGKIFAKSRNSEELFDTTKPLLGFYELLAERLTDSDDLGSSIERGHELEAEAQEKASEELGINFVHGNVWELDENHIESPDGYTEDLTEAIEIKCLSSARHIMAIYTNQYPQEYMSEYVNYFVVNDKLKRLFVYLYDARFIEPQYRSAVWVIERDDVESYIERMKQIKKEALKQIERAIREMERR